MAESDPLHSAFDDGFGVRVADTDPGSGDALERLYVSDTFKTVVEQLRERTGRLTNLRHIRFVRLRSIERDPDKRFYILADATPGIRLARVLELTSLLGLTVDVDTVIHVLRELLPALALLHDSRSVTHGAVGPERLLVTDKGRVVVGDHMFGSALDKLRLSRARLWQDLRVPMPPAAGVPRFDKRSDVSQVGMVALAMLLGRPLRDEEFPTRIPSLLDSLTETHRGGHTERLSKELRAWLERALPIDARKPFLATKEAQASLEDVVAGRKAYSPNSAALKAFVTKFLTEYSRRGPVTPETAAPSPAAPESVPPVVVHPVAAPPPAPVELPVAASVPPPEPVASDVAASAVGDAAQAREPVTSEPDPPRETAPTQQKAAVAESTPKRRGGSKKKAPAPAWHPSIDETEAEEIRRLEAELSRLAALEADGSSVTARPAASSAQSDSEHVIEQVIDLDGALDLLAEEAAPANDDGTWLLEAPSPQAVDAIGEFEPSLATLSEPGEGLESSLELAVDLGDALAFEANFGRANPLTGPAQLIDLGLNDTDRSEALVVEHFGVASLPLDPSTVRPDEREVAFVEHSAPAELEASVALVNHLAPAELVPSVELVSSVEPAALAVLAPTVDPTTPDELVPSVAPVALDETAESSSPAALVSDSFVDVDAGDAARGSDVIAHADHVEGSGGDTVVEAVAIEPTIAPAVEPEEEGDDRFELTPPDAVALTPVADALVEAERSPQAELDFECEAVEYEESIDDGFALVAWAPSALDSGPSEATAGDEIAPLAFDDGTPCLPFESLDVVSDDATSGGDARSEQVAALLDPCPAPEPLAPPAREVAQPAFDEWLATGTDGPADHAFSEPLAFDPEGRARSRTLECDLGGFDQPSVWSWPRRWRVLEGDTGRPNAHEDGDRAEDAPHVATAPQSTEPDASSLDGPRVETEAAAEHAAASATECASPADLVPPSAAPEERVSSLPSTNASDAGTDVLTLVDPPRLDLELVVPVVEHPPAQVDAPHEPLFTPEAGPQADAQAPKSEEVAVGDAEARQTLLPAAAIETARIGDSHPGIEHARVVEVERAPDSPSALLVEPAPEQAPSVEPETAPPQESTFTSARMPQPAPEAGWPIVVATEPDSAASPSSAAASAEAREDAYVPRPLVEPAHAATIATAADGVLEGNFSSEAEPTEVASTAASAPADGDTPTTALAPQASDIPGVDSPSDAAPETEPVLVPEPVSDCRFALSSEVALTERPEDSPPPEIELVSVREGASDVAPDVSADVAPEERPHVATATATAGAQDGGCDVGPGSVSPSADAAESDESSEDSGGADEADSATAATPTTDVDAAATATARGSKRSRRRKKKASGESLTRRSSFAPVRIERPPMPAPPWLRGKASAVPADGDVTTPETLAQPAPASPAAASSTPSTASHVPSPSAVQGEVPGAAAPATPAPIGRLVEPHVAGHTLTGHASPNRVPSPRPALNVGRLAVFILVGLLVEAVVLGGWAVMSRPDTTGRLLIVTRPKGIRVIVDGTVVGDTPYAAPVAPGKHAVQLTGRSITRTIDIDVPPSAQGGAFVRWPTEAARGSVSISSVPDGARVSIDGEEKGLAPVTVHDLIAGAHTVTVTGKRGSVETTVEVKADRTVSIEVPIYSGWVSVFSAVPLDITENGKLLGNTESDRIMLGAGAHTLEVQNVSLGYRETRTVQVVPGKVVPVSIELPTAPLFIDVEPGAEIWVDGERVGYTPAMDLRAPIGTRVVLLKREGQPDERHVVSVRLPGPTRVGPTQP